MIEQDNLALMKLCYLLEQLRKGEISYHRATYRVSYYRKIKLAIERNDTTATSETYSKWRNKNLELAKKIEAARITSLRKHRDLLKLKNKLRSPIHNAAKKADIMLTSKAGKLFLVRTDHSPKAYTEADILDLAARYEATMALEKVLAAK
jgi:hypothetical protein